MSPVLTPEPNISTEYDALTVNKLKGIETQTVNYDNEYFLISQPLEDSWIYLNDVIKVSQFEVETKETFNISENQVDLISLANNLFKGSKPMEGREGEILHKTFLRTVKRKPTLPGRI